MNLPQTLGWLLATHPHNNIQFLFFSIIVSIMDFSSWFNETVIIPIVLIRHLEFEKYPYLAKSYEKFN